jgi:HK97 family phage major capsid protein
MSSNARIAKTAIETSDFLSAGLLNPEQQEEFVRLVRNGSVLLDEVRQVDMNQSSMQIDKRHVGEPVTRSAQENVDAGYFAKPEMNAIYLNAKKVQSNWAISTETLQDNIEQEQFEQTLMEDFTQRVSKDLELLAINGDTNLPSSTPQGALLSTLDGWAKKAEDGHTLDARGNTINTGLFNRARQSLPKDYRRDPDLMWIVPDAVATDWLDELEGTRQTAVGDRAISGETVNPLGIEMMVVDSIPDNQMVTSPDPTPAYLIGDRQGPFKLVGGTDTLVVDVTNDGSTTNHTINFQHGVHEVSVVANAIEDQTNGGLIVDGDGEGRLKLQTRDQGQDTAITVDTNASNSAHNVLGFDGSTYSGADSGGSVPRGTFMFLTNPENLIWGILEGTRVVSEYDKDFDRVETVMYNQVATAIENPNAIVKVKNIRRKQYVT